MNSGTGTTDYSINTGMIDTSRDLRVANSMFYQNARVSYNNGSVNIYEAVNDEGEVVLEVRTPQGTLGTWHFPTSDDWDGDTALFLDPLIELLSHLVPDVDISLISDDEAGNGEPASLPIPVIMRSVRRNPHIVQEYMDEVHRQRMEHYPFRDGPLKSIY